MRNITDEQIEKAFKNELEIRMNNNIIINLTEPKMIIGIGIYFGICILFLICSPNIMGLIIRMTAFILIFIVLLIIIYIILVVSSSKKLFPLITFKQFILSAAVILKMKKYKDEPQKAEEYLLKKIKKYEGKMTSLTYIETLFQIYIKSLKYPQAREIAEYAEKIKNKTKCADNAIALMEFAMSIENKEHEKTVKIFEENEDLFSENALNDARHIETFLNNLGEYKFALGEYDEALTIFIKCKNVMERYNQISPAPIKYKDEEFAGVNTDIAKCLVKLSLYDDAQNYLKEAEHLCNQKYILFACEKLKKEINLQKEISND